MNENRRDQEALDIVKTIIQEELARHGHEVVDIILFGGRARGDFQPDRASDIF